MRNLKRALGIMLLAVTVSVPARAQLITFDDLTPSGFGSLIPNGYQGYNWSNWYALNSSSNFYNPSGYQNGSVSPENVAFNGFADPASVSSGSTFTASSVYVTAAWNDGLNVLIEGLNGGVGMFSTVVVVDTTGPTFVPLGWSGIDELRISGSGGTAHYTTGAHHVVIDNLSLNATANVPEGGSLALLGAGLVPLGFALRRRMRR
jgi:hypothetical protein